MGQFTWTEPLGNVSNGNFLTFSYRMNYRWNNADKLVYNIPDDYEYGDIMPPVTLNPDGTLTTIEPDPDYSNRYRNNSFNQNIRLGYKKVTKNSTLEAGLSLVPQMSKSIYLDNSDKNIDRWVWNYAPFLRYRYKFSKRRSIQLNYRGRSSQPSMAQLQPVADISNPTNIIQGNPNLDPSFTHNVNIRFQDFNTESQRSIMLMGDFQMTQNSIISKSLIKDDGTRETTYANVNGVWSGRVMNMFSMPLRNKKWSLSNHVFVNANRSVGFNNGQRNASLSLESTRVRASLSDPIISNSNCARAIQWKPPSIVFRKTLTRQYTPTADASTAPTTLPGDSPCSPTSTTRPPQAMPPATTHAHGCGTPPSPSSSCATRL